MTSGNDLAQLVQDVAESPDFPGAMDVEDRLAALLLDQRAEVDRLEAENGRLVQALVDVGKKAVDSVAYRFAPSVYVSDVLNAEERP